MTQSHQPHEDILASYYKDQPLTALEQQVTTEYRDELSALGLHFEQRQEAFYVTTAQPAEAVAQLRERAGRIYQEGNYRSAAGLNALALRLSLSFDDRHLQTLESLNSLVRCCQDMGDVQRALALSREAYDRCLAILTDTHLQTLQSLVNLADCVRFSGNLQGV
jgi:hypothetical protein